jgi:hypothetical protein
MEQLCDRVNAQNSYTAEGGAQNRVIARQFGASVAPIKAMVFGSINVRRSGLRSATALGTDEGLGFPKSTIMTKSVGDFASLSHINRARCFGTDRRSKGRLDSFPKKNAGPESSSNISILKGTANPGTGYAQW